MSSDAAGPRRVTVALCAADPPTTLINLLLNALGGFAAEDLDRAFRPKRSRI